MKKVLTIITIMVILLSINIISNAALELTEENLSALLDEVCGYEKTIEATSEDGRQTAKKTISIHDFTYEIDTNQDTIKIKIQNEEIDEEIVLNYYLNDVNKPKFIYNLTYTKDMTSEEFGNEALKGFVAEEIIFTTIGKSKGILPEDTAEYIMEKSFNPLFWKLSTLESAADDVINSAKELYGESGRKLNISDEYMKFEYEKESETAEEYRVKATLEIKETADFSKLEGYAIEKLKEDFAKNSTNKEENIISNQISNSLENTNSNQENNVVANIQKIPQTGNEISLQKILYSVIVIATLLGVCLTVYNKKH